MTAGQVSRLLSQNHAAQNTVWAVSISLDGGTTALAAACPSVARSEASLDVGGLFVATAGIFRVARALLSELPEPGRSLQWRPGHTGAWSAPLLIFRVVAPVGSPVVALHCREKVAPR